MNLTLSLTVTTSLSSLPLLVAKLREIEELGGAQDPVPPMAAPPITPPATADEAPADLTDAQGRLFVMHCSAKTLEVLRTILNGRSLPFRLTALAKELGWETSDLGWVWGGLTKRVRNVLGDRNARLIVWHNHFDAAGKWVDADGIMAETAVSALRKALTPSGE